MHYFLTGHTGFKGAWLTLMLTEQGHTVSGMSLDPVPGALYERADIGRRVNNDIRGDIRDAAVVAATLKGDRPDVVIHLAAQPLVRESYREPRATVETNVNGTLNVLQAVSDLDSVEALLVITTDKVYRNIDTPVGYREQDALGGGDPYSASKAMADILVQSWTASFPGPPTAIARAGNVIGGGDASEDRLLPDLVRAFAAQQPAAIRLPEAVRPWQHVLDCLHGYQLLVEALRGGRGEGAWNFGPGPTSFATVADVSQRAARAWGGSAQVITDDGPHPHEAGLLTLDSTHARQELGWSDRLTLDDAIAWTVAWEKSVRSDSTALATSVAQLQDFAALA